MSNNNNNKNNITTSNNNNGWEISYVRSVVKKQSSSDGGRKRCWKEIDLNKKSKVISFIQEGTDDGDDVTSVRINIYYTTKTIGTCLNHPKQGKTQLFRKNCTAEEFIKILNNPRFHTPKGYQQKPKQENDNDKNGKNQKQHNQENKDKENNHKQKIHGQEKKATSTINGKQQDQQTSANSDGNHPHKNKKNKRKNNKKKSKNAETATETIDEVKRKEQLKSKLDVLLKQIEDLEKTSSPGNNNNQNDNILLSFQKELRALKSLRSFYVEEIQRVVKGFKMYCDKCYEDYKDEDDFLHHFCNRQCPECERIERHSSKVYTSEEEYHNHLVNDHHWLRCPKFYNNDEEDCNVVCYSLEDMKRHCHEEHDGEDFSLHICQDCNITFDNEIDSKHHFCNRKCFECERNEQGRSEVYTDEREYCRHLIDKHVYVKCKSCFDPDSSYCLLYGIFSSTSEHEKHCKDYHDYKNYYPCDICDREGFEYKWELDDHWCRRCCAVCDGCPYTDSDEYKDHMKEHHDWLQCYGCNNIYCDFQELQTHCLDRHDETTFYCSNDNDDDDSCSY